MTYDQWIVNDQSNGNYDVRNEIIYITKIDGKKIDDTEDLDWVTLMYNFL